MLGIENYAKVGFKAKVFVWGAYDTWHADEGGGLVATEAVEAEEDFGAVRGGNEEEDGGRGIRVCVLEKEEGGGRSGRGD